MTWLNQRTPLTINELRKKLHKLGATVDDSTLQKWARQGIIPPSIPQQPEKGRVGRRRKAGNKGGRHSLYPPEAFEDAAAAWCVVEAARRRGERQPTVGTIRLTMVYANRVMHAYSSDYDLAKALRSFDYVPQPQALPDHLAQNEMAKLFFKSSTTSGNEKGLVEGVFLYSPDYQPHIVSYICGWVKSLNDCDLRTPVVVSFIWQSPDSHADDVEIEIQTSPFDCDCLSLVNIEGGHGAVSCATTPTYLLTSACSNNREPES